MVELNLNMIISQNPYLRNALHRRIKQPLIRKTRKFLFIQKYFLY